MNKRKLNYKKELDDSYMSGILKGFLRKHKLEHRYEPITRQVFVSEDSLPNPWLKYQTIVMNVIVIEVARHAGISQSKAYDEFVWYYYY